MLHPHLPEEIKSFSKHLFATFLGLLMALGLEQWREHHHETKLASQALTTVEAELREDLIRVNRESGRCEQSIKSMEALDGYLTELIAAKRQAKPLPPLLVQGNIGIAPYFFTDAWETFKGIGAIRHITPDRAKRLSRAYLTLGSMGQRFESNPLVRQIPASFFLYMEHIDHLSDLDIQHLEQVHEGAKLLVLAFRWARNEMGFVRENCEIALKP